MRVGASQLLGSREGFEGRSDARVYRNEVEVRRVPRGRVVKNFRQKIYS